MRYLFNICPFLTIHYQFMHQPSPADSTTVTEHPTRTRMCTCTIITTLHTCMFSTMIAKQVYLLLVFVQRTSPIQIVYSSFPQT